MWWEAAVSTVYIAKNQFNIYNIDKIDKPILGLLLGNLQTAIVYNRLNFQNGQLKDYECLYPKYQRETKICRHAGQ